MTIYDPVESNEEPDKYKASCAASHPEECTCVFCEWTLTLTYSQVAVVARTLWQRDGRIEMHWYWNDELLEGAICTPTQPIGKKPHRLVLLELGGKSESYGY